MSEIIYKPKKPKLSVPARYEKSGWQDVPKEIQAIVEKMGETRKGLFLHGAVGTGKTHIAYAVGKHVFEDMRKHVKVFNSAELISELRDDFERHPEGRFSTELQNFKGLLIVDDIGAERITNTGFVEEQFYLIVNRKYNDMLPVLFTSNYDIATLSEKLGERIASRIVEMCEVIELGGDDRRMPRN